MSLHAHCWDIFLLQLPFFFNLKHAILHWMCQNKLALRKRSLFCWKSVTRELFSAGSLLESAHSGQDSKMKIWSDAPSCCDADFFVGGWQICKYALLTIRRFFSAVLINKILFFPVPSHLYHLCQAGIKQILVFTSHFAVCTRYLGSVSQIFFFFIPANYKNILVCFRVSFIQTKQVKQ